MQAIVPQMMDVLEDLLISKSHVKDDLILIEGSCGQMVTTVKVVKAGNRD